MKTFADRCAEVVDLAMVFATCVVLASASLMVVNGIWHLVHK